MYINDDVGKCNRLDKCGYHYPPRQYFADHPWLNDNNGVASLQNIGKSNGETATNLRVASLQNTMKSNGETATKPSPCIKKEADGESSIRILLSW